MKLDKDSALNDRIATSTSRIVPKPAHMIGSATSKNQETEAGEVDKHTDVESQILLSSWSSK